MIAVPDGEILEAVRTTARLGGVFGEPAGVAGVAGLRRGRDSGVIGSDESVLIVITGNGLKDIGSARRAVGDPISITPDMSSLQRALSESGVTLP
jgi:threonine synthase